MYPLLAPHAVPERKTYRLKVTCLSGLDIALSEEQFLLVCENPQQLRRFGPDTDVERLDCANAVLSLLVEDGEHHEIVERLGLTGSQLSHLYRILEAQGRIDLANQASEPVVLDSRPINVHLLESALRWVSIRDVEAGQYIAFPRPKRPESREVILDLGEICGYPYTENWVYCGGKAGQEYAEAYEWLEHNGCPTFKWGERRPFLSQKEWNSVSYGHAQDAYRKGRIPERVRRHICVEDDLAYAFGFYLAQGWAEKGRVSFAHNVAEPECFQRAVRGIRHVDPDAGATWTHLKGTKGAVGRVHSAVAARLFEAILGHGAREKRIPESFDELPDSALAAFLTGLVDGDGYWFRAAKQGSTVGDRGQPRLGLTSTNLPLLLHVQRLILRWGMVFSLIRQPAPKAFAEINGKQVRSGESWVLIMRGEAAAALAQRLGYEGTEHSGGSARWSFVTEEHVFLRVLSVDETAAINAAREAPYMPVTREAQEPMPAFLDHEPLDHLPDEVTKSVSPLTARMHWKATRHRVANVRN